MSVGSVGVGEAWPTSSAALHRPANCSRSTRPADTRTSTTWAAPHAWDSGGEPREQRRRDSVSPTGGGARGQDQLRPSRSRARFVERVPAAWWAQELDATTK